MVRLIAIQRYNPAMYAHPASSSARCHTRVASPHHRSPRSFPRILLKEPDPEGACFIDTTTGASLVAYPIHRPQPHIPTPYNIVA